uniref:Uncharacterized protein n=1 Tax=Ananas comosus var. bracteatus TaxID=296719 RepID=A0A6V7Q9X3_ANACO|nr:unnamed protein product [Ananas comosus var. bracteatus]
MLKRNTTIKAIIFSECNLQSAGARHLASALAENDTVEELQIWEDSVGSEGAEELSRMIEMNYALKLLLILDKDPVTATPLISATIARNRTTELHIWGGESTDSKRFKWAKEFAGALEQNKSLKKVKLSRTCLKDKAIVYIGCTGVEGDVVLQTIMETLQVNPWIEEIDLSGTPLQIAGKADGIYEKLIQNGAPIPENDLLTDLPQTMPTCCRLFLCGQELAGKTTLCNSIYHNMNATDSQYMDRIRSLIEPVEKIAGAPDIKIRTIHDGDMTISIWNLAGQHENCALQDLMFPGHGSPSFFLIISSLFRKPANRDPKSPTEIEEDLLYWLKFIVSSSRRTLSRMLLPHVSVVLTHSDKVCHLSGDLHSTVAAIQRLREDFRDYIDFYPTVFSVDARSSTSVSKLTHHIRKISRTIVQRAPQVYRFCNDLINHLNDWRSRNYGKP